MKYIIFQDQSFILIPKFQNHKDYAYKVPISAGFCTIESYRNDFDNIRYKISCYGRSDSLNISSRKEDETIILNGLM